jgi:uroporphyrinogen-III synthase
MFTGRRIALLEARMSEEAATLVRNLGGIPDSVPAVREVIHPHRIGRFLDDLVSGHRPSVVIFLTGIGVSTLFSEASRRGCLEATLAALRTTIVACRGPKPMSVLRLHDVPVHVAPAEPFTTKELIEALEAVEVHGSDIALVHYGQPNHRLVDALLARGARVEELQLYEWTMPEDVEPLRSLVHRLIEGLVDAIAFTNEIQCRHLFAAAAELDLTESLVTALNTNTVVAVVGPVCAEALRAVGVAADVMPARPRMAPMIDALAEYFELTDGLTDEEQG